VIAGAWLAAAAAACSKSPVERQVSDLRGEVARLQRATATLQHQLELATGKEFYLVLDPIAPDLALLLRGAELQRYSVLGVTVGQPRRAWVGLGGDRHWRGVIWTAAKLDPARRSIASSSRTASPGRPGPNPRHRPVPPTAEERYPVPSRYRIRFADGLSVEIRPREADTTAGRWVRMRTWWGAKWRDVLAVLRSRTATPCVCASS